MTLTDAGESRIRGYLFVLDRSLRTFLSREAAADAVREVESHISERIEQIEVRERRRSPAEAALPGRGAKAEDRLGQIPANGDEHDVIERVLSELGTPLRVARAYAREMALDEAETTGRVVPVARAIWHLTTSSLYGFVWGVLVLAGWAMSLSLLAIAVLKPIFPSNVGLIVMTGGAAPGLHAISVPRFSIGVLEVTRSFTYGAMFPLPPGAEVQGGYWVIPISIAAALLVLVLTHLASRRMLGWLRSRKSPGRLRLRVVVDKA